MLCFTGTYISGSCKARIYSSFARARYLSLSYGLVQYLFFFHFIFIIFLYLLFLLTHLLHMSSFLAKILQEENAFFHLHFFICFSSSVFLFRYHLFYEILYHFFSLSFLLSFFFSFLYNSTL